MSRPDRLTLVNAVGGEGRIVNGARCVWWDSIGKAVANRQGLPTCPHCGSVLFETPSEAAWWDAVDGHERAGNPGYRAQLEWLRGRCFPTWRAAVDAYEQARREGPA